MADYDAVTLQQGFDVCCEWGRNGVDALAKTADVAIIVDVLSFSTSVEIATARGAFVLPYRWRDESARAYAREREALLAERNERGFGLKPASLLEIEAGCRLVLPSPNGSELSTATGNTVTIAGALRNASAVAAHAAAHGGRILVVPAGERWPDGSLRPALEDWLGAGAIVQALPASLSRSPEARAAAATFGQLRTALFETVAACASGREKHERGDDRDVELAAAFDVSRGVPVLRDGAYAAAS